MSEMQQQLDVTQFFSPRRLRLLILPTEKCNFRCTYCYEDFAIGRMASHIADGVIALVESRASSLDSLDIDWFGGEPLLAKNIIYRIGSAVFEIAQAHGIRFRSSITTNGYLLSPEVAHELIDRGLSRFMVSMDGRPSVHDARRPTADGRPTFNTIAKNISALLAMDHHFKLILRIHFDPTTVEDVRRFVAAEIQDWSEDDRVEVLFVHLENLADNKAVHVPQMSLQERKDILSELRNLVPRAKSNQDSLNVCYAAQPNAFVIRADGRLAKCTVALRDEVNTVGSLTSDGRLLVDNEKARVWMAGWATGDSHILACPYSAIASSKGTSLSDRE
jgi:uncharacterized protein